MQQHEISLFFFPSKGIQYNCVELVISHSYASDFVEEYEKLSWNFHQTFALSATLISLMKGLRNPFRLTVVSFCFSVTTQSQNKTL